MTLDGDNDKNILSINKTVEYKYCLNCTGLVRIPRFAYVYTIITLTQGNIGGKVLFEVDINVAAPTLTLLTEV